jgi:peptidyl-prolyl cis-trans isomerase C
MNITRYISIMAVILLLVIPPASCAQKPDEGTKTPVETQKTSTELSQEILDNSAAIVNGNPIPMSEMDTALRNIAMQSGMGVDQSEALAAKFGQRIIDQLISGELLYQEGEKTGYEASTEKIDEAFNDLLSRYETEDAFKEEMSKRGFTEITLRENMKKQITIQDFIEGAIVPSIEIADEEVKKIYNDNPDMFTTPEEIQASHILINVSEGDAQEKKDEALDRIRKIAAIAREDGADFAQLARDNSEGPSASNGGDLGFFGRGRMVPAFEKAAFALKVGDVSDPVLTQFGYHVIKLMDKKGGGTVTFEETKDQLIGQLRNEKVNQAISDRIEELKYSSDIKILYNPPKAEASQSVSPH